MTTFASRLGSSMRLLRRKSVQVSKFVSSKKDDTTRRQAIFFVDSDTLSVHSKGEESIWEDERGIVALRKFYALRDEAENTVFESKRIWMDTPFSLNALQCKFPFD